MPLKLTIKRRKKAVREGEGRWDTTSVSSAISSPDGKMGSQLATISLIRVP